MKVVNAVKAQGATNIVFMLFPSGDNKKTQYYAGDFQGEVRDALKAAVGVKVIDYDGSALQNDGVHYQFGVYKKAGDEVRKIFGPANGITLGPSDATPGALTTKDKAQVQDVAMRAFRTDGSFYVPPLIGNKGPEIADLQKALVALGYQLPKYGVDGIMGKETKTAIQAFQSDKQLHTDGIAGKDTLAALNKAITDNPKVASSLRKSTQADVKSRVQNIATGDAKGGSGATGSAMTAVKFFINKGWTPEQSAGIVGNLQAESGKDLKVDIVGDNGQAYGIAQWHPPRQATFRKTIGKDIVGSTLQDQLSFVDWELNNTESNAGRQLKTAKTAEEAAWIMDEYYERSSGAHRQKRINNAVALLPQSTTTA
jgi:peptidoglycan hydrolase-like protein with peptidoglycan-binding domain